LFLNLVFHKSGRNRPLQEYKLTDVELFGVGWLIGSGRRGNL